MTSLAILYLKPCVVTPEGFT